MRSLKLASLVIALAAVLTVSASTAQNSKSKARPETS